MPDHPISKAVLITGCSTGIGRATAVHLAGRGHTVYATARRVDDIADLTEAGCRVLALDVTDEGSMRAVVDQVVSAEGAVGVLVNNAGYSQSGPIEEVPLDEVRRQFETNVFGLVRLTQLVLPGMRSQRWGRIVNLSSMGGRMTLPGGGYYHATKYAVEAISDALRFEVAGFGVRVVLVEPGPVATRFGDTAAASVPTTTAGTGTADPDSGAYAGFNAALAKVYADTYEDPDARGTFAPEKVAQVIGRAIEARHPRPRYLIGSVAKGLVGARRFLPDRAWDSMLRRQFPSPTP